MSQVNSFFLYMISNEGILCVDVLSSIMESGIPWSNLIAEVLSIRRVEFTCFSCKSSSIFLSHTIFFIAYTATTTTYYASVVEFVETDCLHDLYETTIDPRIRRYPEVDTPFSSSPTKFESTYPIRLKSSTFEYLIPKS
jgi:hypothetical protein